MLNIDLFSFEILDNYLDMKLIIPLIAILFSITSAMIVVNILVWTIPSKSKKKALKNINGDKKIYNRLWCKSGFFIAFTILSTLAILYMISNTLLIIPTSPILFEFYYDFGPTINSIVLIISAIFTFPEFIVMYLISIVMKSKADNAALRKSSHTKAVHKVRAKLYNK